jgi:hypothetical protein
MTPPQETLETLTDRLAIQYLVHTYARSADRRESATAAGCFTDDGRLLIFREGDGDTPTTERTGHAQIAEAMDGLSRWQVTMHMVGQHTSWLDGDSATGETYCLAHHLYERDGVRMDRVMHIRYLDQYRRTPDGWRIAERHLHEDWVEYRPVKGFGGTA